MASNFVFLWVLCLSSYLCVSPVLGFVLINYWAFLFCFVLICLLSKAKKKAGVVWQVRRWEEPGRIREGKTEYIKKISN